VRIESAILHRWREFDAAVGEPECEMESTCLHTSGARTKTRATDRAQRSLPRLLCAHGKMALRRVGQRRCGRAVVRSRNRSAGNEERCQRSAPQKGRRGIESGARQELARARRRIQRHRVLTETRQQKRKARLHHSHYSEESVTGGEGRTSASHHKL